MGLQRIRNLNGTPVRNALDMKGFYQERCGYGPLRDNTGKGER